jgi:hypothetical protein
MLGKESTNGDHLAVRRRIALGVRAVVTPRQHLAILDDHRAEGEVRLRCFLDRELHEPRIIRQDGRGPRADVLSRRHGNRDKRSSTFE